MQRDLVNATNWLALFSGEENSGTGVLGGREESKGRRREEGQRVQGKKEEKLKRGTCPERQSP